MVMVMTCAGMGDAVLRERLPALWRRIEDAHYSYLETDDSPEKLQQKKKLEDYIIEYLSLVPHECKFGLTETGKVFQRTINELSDFSAYRAGLGWAALARYAANLLAQPWRKEYRVIRLYCGYFKHEVEANMVGAEILLHTMGYKSTGAGRLELDGPICPDMVAAVSRDALIAQCECQIMSHIWEAVWSAGARVSWRHVCAERAARAAPPAQAAASLAARAPPAPPTEPEHGYDDGAEIYSNIPTTIPSEPYRSRLTDSRYEAPPPHCNHLCEELLPPEDTAPPMHPYMMPQGMMPQVMYPHLHPDVPVTMPHCSTVPMMTPYGVPYYYPVQSPYMIPTPVYAPIKHAATVPVNGYPPMPQYRYPSVPTAQLIELDTPSVYENGKFERYKDEERSHRKSRPLESSRRNSTSKSGLSDVTLPSLPRSDTQPALSKAREDGMGTYESWDYVFRNLSSKEQEPESRSRFSPSLDRDSRTLDRLDREERRAKYQPTTLDLEDGLQALNLDRSYDDEVYRTAKVNEIMRMKQEQELKRARHLAKKQIDERKSKKHVEPVGNPKADALITPKVAADKVKLLSKKDIRDRKEVIKQQNSVNGSSSNTAEVKKVKKPSKPIEVDKTKSKPVENGVHSSGHSSGHSSKTNHASSNAQPSSYDLKAQLIVSLDETDHVRRSPPKQAQLNGDRPASRTPSQHNERDRPDTSGEVRRDKWQCATCTFLNRSAMQACEMCGKSKRGPEIQPLRSGGRECPACTLVNERDAKICDACGTSLEHCPTYI
ncbi:PUB and ZnF_RBZ domain-containing protein tamozhennic [Anticarsia gemmatalis]|uniref:PUB and ZnF_RBZ domain-containing protein tamozhennic n=1 Tax=Anticarsia gemmatalis TaxID=129554 RepID=UPI003F760B07